jgi:branched-chain amino acid transport system substrate-binding protein
MRLAIYAVLGVAGALLGSTPSIAGDTIKIGMIGPYSGLYADLAKRQQNGANLYLKLHDGRMAGKKVDLLFRDDNNGSPDVAKRLSQELAIRDNVDILSGYISTPSAMSSGPVATAAKKPMLIIQAATSGITEKSPYVARLSYTIGQVAAPLGTWAAKNGIKTVFTLVSDYGPGYNGLAAFSKTFTAGGGKIVGGIKVPLANLEFGPFVQRAKDAKPDAVFIFVPAGETATALMKTVAERGLSKAGIRVITSGDVVSESGLDAIGDSALGVISSFHYSTAHDSPENKAFIEAYAKEFGTKVRPDFIAIQAYDTMATIDIIATQLKGDLDPKKFIAALKNFKLNSPRGSIVIDANTREVVQDVYIRRVERRSGRLENIEFDKIAAVHDPGK